MVGDRSHFHFLQLHNWTAVLNCTHNYHIAGDEQLSNSCGWILIIGNDQNYKDKYEKISYGFISILALLSSFAVNHFCIWNSYNI